MNRFRASILLIRLAVGGVFLSEGLQKFLFPEELGFGRFAKIGIPVPGFTAPFVGFVEVVCGLLLIIGPVHSLGNDFASPRYGCGYRNDQGAYPH